MSTEGLTEGTSVGDLSKSPAIDSKGFEGTRVNFPGNFKIHPGWLSERSQPEASNPSDGTQNEVPHKSPTVDSKGFEGTYPEIPAFQ